MVTVENGNEFNENVSRGEQLRNVLTQTMSISPELFESMYLAPKNKVSGELRKTFANPTPLAILGFSVGLFPLSIELSKSYSVYTLRSSKHIADTTRSGLAWIRRFRNTDDDL